MNGRTWRVFSTEAASSLRRGAAACLAIALLAPTGAMAVKRPHPSKLSYPPLKVITPEAIDIALPNGLEGFLIPDHEIPVVDIILLVKTYFPERSKYGLNEMAQWTIRNGGSASWPGDRINDELEFLAGDVEVYGSDLNTTFYVSCMKKDLSRVLEILADLVVRPVFPGDKVELRRKTMLEEIRRRYDQPDAVSGGEFDKLVYGEHPYGWETTKDSVEGITHEDLVRFHETYFHPNNAIIGISGDVEKDEILAILGKVLGGWEPADVTIPTVPDMPAETGPSVNYAYMDISQAYIRLGHQGINSRNPDRCAVEIMNHILGGGSFTSWITEKVRSDEGLAYHAGSDYGEDPFAEGVFSAEAQTKCDACGRAISIIREQIVRMRDVGPNPEEVKKAVDSYLNAQVFDYESKRQVVSRLVQLRFEGRPLDTPQRDMEIFARLTVDDVRDAARRYLDPDKLTLLVVGNAAQFDRPLTDYGAVREIRLEKTE